MTDEPVNTSIEENLDGLTITPTGDDGQPPEPIVTEPAISDVEEPIIVDEHEEPLPQIDDQNALRSWLGRRDKRTEEKFDAKLKQTVDSLVQGIAPLIKQAQQPPEVYQPPQPSPAVNLEELDFINDANGSFKKLFDHYAPTFATNYIPQYNAEHFAKMEQKANQVLTGIDFLAKSDPLLKEDSERLVEIAKKLPFRENMDAVTAAKITFTEAQNILLREKMQKKINPLSGNKPVTKPIGSISPSAPGKQVVPKVNLSQEVKNEGFKMGFTEEEMYKFLE